MKITYESPDYTPEHVTGRYVRCEGRKGAYTFKVIESTTGTGKYFNGKPGHGPTIREYVTDGAELPEELRNRCIASKLTELWDYPNPT